MKSLLAFGVAAILLAFDYASFRLGEFYFYKDENARAKIYLDRLAGKPDFIFANRVADYRKKLTGR